MASLSRMNGCLVAALLHPGPSILSRMLGCWAACSGSSFWGRLIYGATAKVISLPQPCGLGLSQPLLKIAQDKESQGPVTSCTQDLISPRLLRLAAQPFWVPGPLACQSQLQFPFRKVGKGMWGRESFPAAFAQPVGWEMSALEVVCLSVEVTVCPKGQGCSWIQAWHRGMPCLG